MTRDIPQTRYRGDYKWFAGKGLKGICRCLFLCIILERPAKTT